jgi:hypothetical protein
MPSHPRPRRVAIAGARAHLANAQAEVVNVSRTGVLIRAPYPLRTGTDWPLTLEISHRPLLLTGRVVRCEPALDPNARPVHHDLALAFVTQSSDAQNTLLQACGGRLERPQPRRHLSLHPISIARRCPRCRATRVVKRQRHQYFCEACQSRFTGLKFGPIRLAF